MAWYKNKQRPLAHLWLFLFGFVGCCCLFASCYLFLALTNCSTVASHFSWKEKKVSKEYNSSFLGKHFGQSVHSTEITLISGHKASSIISQQSMWAHLRQTEVKGRGNVTAPILSFSLTSWKKETVKKLTRICSSAPLHNKKRTAYIWCYMSADLCSCILLLWLRLSQFCITTSMSPNTHYDKIMVTQL